MVRYRYILIAVIGFALVAAVIIHRNDARVMYWYRVSDESDASVGYWYTAEIWAEWDTPVSYEPAIGDAAYTNAGNSIYLDEILENRWYGQRDFDKSEFPPSFFLESYWDQRLRGTLHELREANESASLSIAIPVHALKPAQMVQLTEKAIGAFNAGKHRIDLPKARNSLRTFVSVIFAHPPYTLEVGVHQLASPSDAVTRNFSTASLVSDDLMIAARHSVNFTNGSPDVEIGVISSRLRDLSKFTVSVDSAKRVEVAFDGQLSAADTAASDILICRYKLEGTIQHRRYPIRRPQIGDLVAVCFPTRGDSEERVVVYAYGKILWLGDDGSLFHDAPTQPFASGAPIISLLDGAVVGFQLEDVDLKLYPTWAISPRELKKGVSAEFLAESVKSSDNELFEEIFVGPRSKTVSE